jgi:transcriptional regulator with XRE-family HTH domain
MASQFKRNFGKRIRQLRTQRGLSQEQLATAARLHTTHISLLERGGRSARLETVERLAIALKVQPAQLMPKIDVD